MPVGAIVAGSARRFGDRVAFRHGEVELSFEELWRRACRCANGLAARGVGRGTRAALRMPNCLAFPVAYYGVLLAGATVVPVSPLLPDSEAAARIDDAGAVMVLTEDDVAELCAGADERPPDVIVDVTADLAHLAYTGGTTGTSKGVELTHRNVVVNTVQHACWHHGCLPGLDPHGGIALDQVGSAEEWPVRLGTGAFVNLMPWHHAMGLIAGLNLPVLAGMTTIIHDRFDPAAYLADVQRFRVTYLAGAPTLYAGLLSCPEIDTTDLSSVRAIGSGGAALPHRIIDELRARMPDAVLCEGYGLTEVTMGATNPPANRSGTRKPGSVGVAMFDTELRIVPLDGSETAGEVHIRGPQVMRGYHDQPAATREVLVDGWLRTGDIGMLDEQGYLTLIDRAKDMLVYKGYNVYPRELERLLLAHSSITAAAVVGRPDDSVGELPVAFVVTAAGHTADPAELMEMVNEQVAPYQKLREVHLVDQLPVSAAGKVLKRELRRRLTDS
ncbi:long-chain acyl-CoA synthetase [Herbihabitans rhizosphaerae]|uniref:Long-chain acyl-CoA synthetase n=1 Tax=Herbihabitans rhizosphaerae TaxID=1872711 RepID=A0A4Q7KN20_9PSEU|nr:long-chain acyl-CoA synthetase [Herbihabitans rhizosphaerae]